MFFQWLEDYEDEQKLLENQAYLIGSFINPALVKKILGKDSEVYESTDEEFEEFSKKLFEHNRKEEQQKPVRRKKRKHKIQG